MAKAQNKILIVSASGFLGATLFKNLPKAGFKVSSAGRAAENQSVCLDLEREVKPQLANDLKQESYSYGIICAAMTDVEGCFKNPQKSKRINVEAVEELLALFKEFSIKPVFFSSDLIFDNLVGNYREDDTPNPITLYGKQKLEVEKKIQANFNDYLIFRTSKLMSMSLHPKSILTPLIKGIKEGAEIRAFVDQYISPVFVEDVAMIVGESLRIDLRGTYHLAGNELISRYELVQILARALSVDPQGLRAISMSDAQFGEPRGPNNTLCAQKISCDLGCEFTPIEKGLHKFLDGEQS